MRLKPYLFLSLFAFTMAGHAGHVLAQNESQQKGFFGRIFNRSDDNSSTVKPLYLNQRQQAPAGGYNPIQPYDFKAQREATAASRKMLAMDDQWERLQEEVRQMQRQDEAETRRVVPMELQKAIRENDERVAREYAAQQAQAGRGGSPQTKKKMVYDPDRVWTYNPNEPRQPEKKTEKKPPPRIYNSTR